MRARLVLTYGYMSAHFYTPARLAIA